MSSTDKTANYQLSQFVGTDIPSILNDYNGDMRKIDSAIKEASVAGGDNATAIAELQATTGRISTEIGGINATVNSLSGRVIGIEGKIPANASADNKLITEDDIPEIPSITQLESDVATLQTTVGTINGEVTDIKNVIPSSASVTNKLATSEKVEGIDDAVETIEKNRYRLLYRHEDGNTPVQDANAILDAFKALLTTPSKESIRNNLPNLILDDGRFIFRFNGTSDGSESQLTFTASKAYAENLEFYTLVLTMTGYHTLVVTNVEGGEIDLLPSISANSRTIKKLSAYYCGGTYLPRHLV